jgi:hypothetical protein
MVIGYGLWVIEVFEWLLVIGYGGFFKGYWLWVMGYWLLKGYWLWVIGY